MVTNTPHHQRAAQRNSRPSVPNSVPDRARIPSPKPLRRWKSTTTHHAKGFWKLLTIAGLSISLTSRALQELDRRNLTDPVKGSDPKALVQEYLPSDIKRFSRHTDYSELRGVSYPCESSP